MSSPISTDMLQPVVPLSLLSDVCAEKVSPILSTLVLMLIIVHLDGNERTKWAENPLLFFHGATGFNISSEGSELWEGRTTRFIIGESLCWKK